MMRWLLAALPIVLASLAAHAQTTTFSTGATCPASVSITSGTSLTFTTTDKINCLASTGKADGAWYFTIVEQPPGHSNAVGVATSALPTDGTVETLGNSASINGTAYWLYYDGGARNTMAGGLSTEITMGPYTPGATMGYAVSLSGAFEYLWVTPDINGTGGCGGGPMWNGSATSSPTVRGGCGGTSTGLQFTMGNNPVYPAIGGQNYGGDQTVANFNFGSNATMDSLLGSGGFQPWNTVGGQTRNLPKVTSNTTNAPLWQQGHAYVAGDRVIAGPGVSGGSYTWGSPIYLWAVSGSGGTSSGSGNGPQSCSSPANYGGGINGSGTPAQWSGHSTVNDNGITWACLTQVDHITIHDMNRDAPAWQAGHLYSNSEWVTANGHGFIAGTATWSDSITCTSGGTPPSPGGGSDGGCLWRDQGAITYSSGNNYILHAISPIYAYVLGILNTATENIWYGGHSNQTYANGAAGEDRPINPARDITYTEIIGSEVPVYCPDGITSITANYAATCGFNTFVNITTAPGDSAGETLGITGGPLRYNPANGVAFTSSGSSTDQSNVPVQFESGQNMIFYGFQLYNPDNTAFAGNADIPNTAGAYWGGKISNVIAKGAGAAAIAYGSGDGIFNSLVIYTGTYPYGSIVAGRFPGNIYNSILIGPGASACPTCIGRQLRKTVVPD